MWVWRNGPRDCRMIFALIFLIIRLTKCVHLGTSTQCLEKQISSVKSLLVLFHLASAFNSIYHAPPGFGLGCYFNAPSSQKWKQREILESGVPKIATLSSRWSRKTYNCLGRHSETKRRSCTITCIGERIQTNSLMKQVSLLICKMDRGSWGWGQTDHFTNYQVEDFDNHGIDDHPSSESRLLCPA